MKVEFDYNFRIKVTKKKNQRNNIYNNKITIQPPCSLLFFYKKFFFNSNIYKHVFEGTTVHYSHIKPKLKKKRVAIAIYK